MIFGPIVELARRFEMSSQNFEYLEDDFVNLKSEIKRKVENVLPKISGESRKNTVREIQRAIDDAQRILSELEDQAQAAPNPYRLQMNARLRGYSHELTRLKKKASESGDTGLYASKPYQSSIGVEAEANALSNRERLLQMNDTVERTSSSVLNAQQVAAETDEVGIAVVEELSSQRESLIRTKERLVDTDANLTKSRKILRSMYRKVITNKLILIVTIVLELAILAAVVYYKFFKK